MTSPPLGWRTNVTSIWRWVSVTWVCSSLGKMKKNLGYPSESLMVDFQPVTKKNHLNRSHHLRIFKQSYDAVLEKGLSFGNNGVQGWPKCIHLLLLKPSVWNWLLLSSKPLHEFYCSLGLFLWFEHFTSVLGDQKSGKSFWWASRRFSILAKLEPFLFHSYGLLWFCFSCDFSISTAKWF